MKIQVKYNAGTSQLCKLQQINGGDWIDLHSEENVHADTGKHIIVHLGVAIKLPKGFEAIIVPRSSSFGKYSFVQANSVGVIDNTYCGNDDIWRMSLLTVGKCVINAGDRICQFRIQLSQRATILQKLRWLFSNKIEFVEVDDLKSLNRGGFGTTGK